MDAVVLHSVAGERLEILRGLLTWLVAEDRFVLGLLAGFFLGMVRDILTERRQTARLRRTLATGLYNEIMALRDQYSKAWSAPLDELQTGQPVDLDRSTSQDFFSVYDGNTDKLGLFGPRETGQIVRAYTLIKGHIESLNQAGRRMEKLAARAAEGRLDPQEVNTVRMEFGRRLSQEQAELMQAGEQAARILARHAGIRDGGATQR